MDMYRAFLAIIISFLFLIGSQYFFVTPVVNQTVPVQETVQQNMETVPAATGEKAPPVIGQVPIVSVPSTGVVVDQTARDILIDTPLYSAVINEQGGGFTSFALKKYTKEKNWDLIVHSNMEGFEAGIGPFTHGSKVHTDTMKTQALLQGLNLHKFDAAFGGARRDEEKCRAKERVYCFRDEFASVGSEEPAS